MGLTLLEAARKLGVDPTKLSRIETGFIRPPDIGEVARWSGSLGMEGRARRELLKSALAGRRYVKGSRAERWAERELDRIAQALAEGSPAHGDSAATGPRTLGECIAAAVAFAVDRKARSITVVTEDDYRFTFSVGD